MARQRGVKVLGRVDLAGYRQQQLSLTRLRLRQAYLKRSTLGEQLDIVTAGLVKAGFGRLR